MKSPTGRTTSFARWATCSGNAMRPPCGANGIVDDDDGIDDDDDGIEDDDDGIEDDDEDSKSTVLASSTQRSASGNGVALTTTTLERTTTTSRPRRGDVSHLTTRESARKVKREPMTNDTNVPRRRSADSRATAMRRARRDQTTARAVDESRSIFKEKEREREIETRSRRT